MSNDEPSRDELIALCERGIVPQDHWYDRDSQRSQAALGTAWALLKAGCEFHLAASPKSDANTWWIRVRSRGFNAVESGSIQDRNADEDNYEDDLFYIPTAARLDRAAGKDWY